jgi:hypothetical protein
MRFSIRYLCAIGALVTITSACTDADPLGVRAAPAGALYQIFAGDGQTAPPGTELPSPVVVRVLDANGTPVPGQIINFVVTAGGGEVFAGKSITDSRGLAQERWVLGSVAGSNVLEARAVDSTTGERLVFATFRATGGDPPPPPPAAPPPPPAEPELTLTATGKKVKGVPVATLLWVGTTASHVDVFRDGGRLGTVRNSGKYEESLNHKGTRTYSYRVCAAGTTVCSAEVQVTL